jgi:hypothetical protein
VVTSHKLLVLLFSATCRWWPRLLCLCTQLQLVSSPLQLGAQATVYTNPLFYYLIKVPEQYFQYKLRFRVSQACCKGAETSCTFYFSLSPQRHCNPPYRLLLSGGCLQNANVGLVNSVVIKSLFCKGQLTFEPLPCKGEGDWQTKQPQATTCAWHVAETNPEIVW